ncbi:MAG: hypothetical protein L0210_00340 [Rhodospirillales bacterium]|nr:hypothetical protein [Rhodospirillales bacterium]
MSRRRANPYGPHRTRSAAAAIAIALGLLCSSAGAATSLDVKTPGGLVIGSRIIRVTSLADSGAGSLRAALDAVGPRVVVFDVAGYIELRSNLPIDHGQVTIAGQTAPGPGIVLRGASLKIHASDVVIQHLAVYVGSTADPKRADNRDGITIYGRPSRNNRVENVVLRNVSVGWGVDENIGINGLVDGVRIERSLIAEGLKYGGSPKGLHSYNLLVGNPVRTLLILGNVFAASNQRSPRVTQGNIVEFLNNFIYGFGRKATHIDSSKSMAGAARIDVIGNLYRRSADSRCRQWPVLISGNFFDSEPPSQVHLADNLDDSPATSACRSPNDEAANLSGRLSATPLATVPSWRLVPASSLYPGILDLVGSYPAKRNPIDARIIGGIRDGTTRLIDNESDVGGWPTIEAVSAPASLPLNGLRITDAAGLSAVATWLCERDGEARGRRGECE